MMAVLSLTFIMLEHVLSFKMTLHSLKLMYAIRCDKYIAGNFYCFLYFLLPVFAHFLEIFLPQSPPSIQLPPYLMYCVTNDRNI